MGTYCAITLVRRPPEIEPERLHEAAKAELDRVEALMSTYRADSDVGRFNAPGHGNWVAVSPETLSLIQQALQIGRLTGGAYDITAGSLVNLWGFGPGRQPAEMPTESQIEEARRHVGPDLLDVQPEPPAVRKRDPQARIDLASIAKGFAVDRAAAVLDRLGVEDYCVDVGGEIRAKGLNPRGVPWQVAIESPETSGRSLHRVIALKDQAIATSGDYRIFTERDGTRYSHIIDPRTGYPIRNTVASVTVLDPSCARADAWATALMVAGPEAGFGLAVREELAALFLLRTHGGVEEKRTPGFSA